MRIPGCYTATSGYVVVNVTNAVSKRLSCAVLDRQNISLRLWLYLSTVKTHTALGDQRRSWRPVLTLHRRGGRNQGTRWTEPGSHRLRSPTESLDLTSASLLALPFATVRSICPGGLLETSTPPAAPKSRAPKIANDRLTRWIGCGIAFALAFFVLLLTMPRYLNVYDESFMLTGALRINSGELPYRDFYAICGSEEQQD